MKIGAAKPRKILEGITGVEGVLDAYAVFGRFDIVVFIEAEEYYKLKDVAAKVARATRGNPYRVNMLIFTDAQNVVMSSKYRVMMLSPDNLKIS